MPAPGPLDPLGTMLQEVLNETGRTLEKEGCSKGLGEWVVRVVKGIPEGPHVAAQFVEKLVNTLPGFADKATYKDKEVFILKKAQLLAADLYRHMRVHANTLKPLKHMAQCSLLLQLCRPRSRGSTSRTSTTLPCLLTTSSQQCCGR
jgi:hypothetical protein